MKLVSGLFAVCREDGSDMTQEELENIKQTIEDMCSESGWVTAGEFKLEDVSDDDVEDA